MIDLEAALADLAEHLDHPAGDDLTAAVRRRIDAPVRAAHDRSRSLLAVAAALLLIVAAALTIPPAREAIADWLGIGAIEIRRSDTPLPTNGPSRSTVPGSPDATAPEVDAPKLLADARKAVEFTIGTPRDPSVGRLRSVAVDRRVPGGLVALGYGRFTLVEVAASDDSDPASVAKFLPPGVRIEHVTVGESPGLWITGAHQVAYLDRSGLRIRTETVRRAGPVLIWAEAGVTYRIEGLDSLTEAKQIAASIR